MLLTSRTPLHLSGEQLLVVPPLPVPAEGPDSTADPAALATNEAVALFVDRAATALPDFALTVANATAVASICRQSEGLPLAIELAAARLRVLSPRELSERLERRLPLLTRGPRDQPDRLRTMRDAIAWSYDLLEPAQQAFFRRLSVFVGGFGVTAAEQVAAHLTGAAESAALDLLEALIDASLVQRGEGPTGEARFVMLETIREFGLERLVAAGEEAAARDTHAAWCLVFAEDAGPKLAGPDHVAWWNRIYVEVGNVRAAHAWLFACRDAERALRLGKALSWFWTATGYHAEGRTLFRYLAEMPEAKAWPAHLASVLGSAGTFEQFLGNIAGAERLFRRSLALHREMGNVAGVVGALGALGSIAIDRDDVDAARQFLDEGLALAPAADAAWDMAAMANSHGVVAFARGEYAAAAQWSEEALSGWQALDDTGHVGAARINYARAMLALGDLCRAAEALGLVLDVVQVDVGDDAYASDCFEIAAGLALEAGKLTAAARLLAAAEAMVNRMGSLRRPGFQTFFEREVAATRIRLGEEAFAEAWEEGATLPLGPALELARAIVEAAVPAQAPATPAPIGPTALTARERDVLRLVASGLSDKEIATALGIARHTASNHVANIRTKLGSPSRAAIAALAVRDGLL